MMTKLGCLIALLVCVIIPHGSRSSASPGPPARPFDEYGRRCFEDEKARLDSFAIELINNRKSIGDIIVYDGKQRILWTS